ncbi:LysR family transcriptional regulator [Massilia niastensis]|uniref:LysR family transcriptional regulator n=1 Tax=Massilia niastensis TaxID=544911 RepID=UPI0003784E92|nr:LysR substrate-binding domain-containing protein [Massilia niastensis]
MDLKQLHALLVVADVGSVTRAADILHIVQPAVSRQLRLLEEDFGTPLFERSRNGMALTDAGQILVDYARRAMHELERARAEIQPSAGAITGIVTVGLLPSTSDLLAGPLVAAVAASHPGIRLRLLTGYTGHLQEWMEAGEVDAALLYDPKPSPALQVTPLLQERLWLVGPADAGLRADRPVELADFAGQPLVLPSAPHGLRSVVEHACSIAGITLSIVAETNSMAIQRSLVMGGHGYTILPSIAVVDDVGRGLVSAAPLTGSDLQRKIVLALPGSRRISAAVRWVVGALEHEMKDAVARGDWREAQWIPEQ